MKLIAAALLTFFAGPSAATQIGSPTFGLATGGGSVWVGGLGSGDVIRVDPATGKILKRVTVGARVFNLAAAPRRGLGDRQRALDRRPHRHEDREA